MGRQSAPAFRKEFWDINRHLLNVEVSGKLAFTDEGLRQYRPLLLRHGYRLDDIASLDDLRRVMRDVEALQRTESPAQLKTRLHHPTTTEVERAALAKVLGVARVPVVAAANSNVVSLAAWRQRK